MHRNYFFASYTESANQLVITTDACPWGMGAVIEENGIITEYFAVNISDADASSFEVGRGEPEGQQVWEALCPLVALRIWQSKWSHKRMQLRVRGDNITMLTMVSSLKGTSPSLNKIARELALEFAAAAFKPIATVHVPGVANVLADKLSRMHAPGYSAEVPAQLAQSQRVFPPARTPEWYVASLPPIV